MPPSSASAYQSLQNFQNTQQNPTDILNNAQTQYGVAPLASQLAALRTTTGNLQNSINGVDASVTGRTQGGLVTEAQRGRLVNMEKAPLVGQFNQASANANELGKQYSTANAMASQFANTAIQGQNQKYTQLLGEYNAANTAEQQAKAQANADRAYQQQVAAAQLAQSNADRAYQLSRTNANRNYQLAATKAAASAKPNAVSIVDYWKNAPSQYGAYNPNGTNLHRWQAAADDLTSQGIDTTRGSAADKILRQVFNQGK